MAPKLSSRGSRNLRPARAPERSHDTYTQDTETLTQPCAYRTFIGCVLVFEIGSAICGAAPSSIVLIVGRAIAGLGSAGIFSGTMIIMIPMIPLRKRPMFQGVFGLVFGTASVLGPLVGGGLTDGVSWRWCFYINLPIGAVAVAALLLTLKLPKRNIKQPSAYKQFVRLDPLGTLFFVPSIVCLLIALEWGGSVYRWQDPRIIALLVVFAVLLVAFAAVQTFLPKTATVPPRVIRQRSILCGAIFMLAIAGSMMMTIYFLPLWFQVVQGVSAVKSGVYTLPFVLSLVIASILGGFTTQKIGYYVPVMLACPSLMAVSQGLLSTFRVGEVSSHWIGFQVIGGFGLGLGMQSASLAAQSVLPMPDVPTGISIMFFTQQLGGAVFTSVGQNLLSTGLVAQLSQIPGIDTSQITSSGSTEFVDQVPADLRPAVLDGYNHAVTRIFLVGMGVALVAVAAALCMEWRNIKKTGPPAAGPPAPAPARRPSSRASATAMAVTAQRSQSYQHHHPQAMQDHHRHPAASSSRGSLKDMPSPMRPLASHRSDEKVPGSAHQHLRDSATLRDSTIAGSDGGRYMYRSAAGSSTQLSIEDEGLRPVGRDYHAR